MMRRIRTLVAFSALTLMILAAGPERARAQEVEYLGTNRDWHAFQYTENGNRVCYMASRPTDEEGDYNRRGDVFVLVTHRPAEDSRDVVSFIAGYTYEEGSEVTVTIGGDTFRLFTEDDTAWARDEATDRRLVGAMRRGADMVVRGTSSRGTLTTDTYSLFGFTATYNEITEACGLS
ncbi:MAG: hypothetical protein GVY13_15620 [Alphaproteobacteria bacterium]|jgi:hypothetical protein|nr:hypothetical protein [Alphaproteobacteria bacterium]